jgi:hypothetical protein
MTATLDQAEVQLTGIGTSYKKVVDYLALMSKKFAKKRRKFIAAASVISVTGVAVLIAVVACHCHPAVPFQLGVEAAIAGAMLAVLGIGAVLACIYGAEKMKKFKEGLSQFGGKLKTKVDSLIQTVMDFISGEKGTDLIEDLKKLMGVDLTVFDCPLALQNAYEQHFLAKQSDPNLQQILFVSPSFP